MNHFSKTGTKLRIVYILASNQPRGGVKIQIEHCNNLAASGHEITIISAVAPPEWIQVQVPWQIIKVPEGKILGGLVPPCDIAVFSFYEQAYTLQAAARDGDFIPVYFAQGDELLFGDPREAENPQQRNHIIAARNSLKFYYPLLTVSNSAAARLMKMGSQPPLVIHNGIDRSVFSPREKNDHGQPLRILSVGSEFPRFKGIADLYAALIKMKGDPEVPSFTFVRASPYPNHFSQLPLETEFHQNPSQEMLAELYSSADLFVGPSHNESFYLPPLEAMACATAVCCSDLESVREYASPGKDFLPFEPGNIPQLYSKIKELLLNKTLRITLVDHGLKVAENYSWPNISWQLENYFRELLHNKMEVMVKISEDLRNPPFSFTTRDLPTP